MEQRVWHTHSAKPDAELPCKSHSTVEYTVEWPSEYQMVLPIHEYVNRAACAKWLNHSCRPNMLFCYSQAQVCTYLCITPLRQRSASKMLLDPSLRSLHQLLQRSRSRGSVRVRDQLHPRRWRQKSELLRSCSNGGCHGSTVIIAPHR